MAIDQFIRKVCVQTAVYWAAPVPDGYGGNKFNYPVEVKVRWGNEEEKLPVTKSQGFHDDQTIKNYTEILTPTDLELGGWIWLGELTDLESQISPITLLTISPKDVANCYEIKKFSKIPMIFSKTVFVRKAYI